MSAVTSVHEDYPVMVCAECLCASCWHGEFYCSKSHGADVVEKPASELRALDLEHPDHYNKRKLQEIYSGEVKTSLRRVRASKEKGRLLRENGL